ncbi:MAG: histidinol dehydrogenase, partial [Desulfobulbaceae bacterium]|nr:histidinol dehydrogenase [Desulfobulbaceae bacterium]
MNIRIEKTSSEKGQTLISELFNRFSSGDSNCETIVRDILNDVQQNGDKAVLRYIRQYDSPNM